MQSTSEAQLTLLKTKIGTIEANNGMAKQKIIDECGDLIEILEYQLHSHQLPEELKDQFEEYRMLFESRFCGPKKIYFQNLLSRSDSGTQSDYDHNERINELQPLLKKSSYERVLEKVEDITHLNTYLNAVVKTQGEPIDNLSFNMHEVGINASNTIQELDWVFERRQRQSRFKRFLVYLGFVVLIIIVMCKFTANTLS